ncbi:MAG: bifunctional precorrin-2 dehydrogenase/sirohydrochlorin ferrochelatase [Anaerolineae bacterium]
MQYYPVYLNLVGRRAVVIGGGHIAEGKVENLLAAEACVFVVAPRLTKRLQRLRDEIRISHIAREYQVGDLEGAFIAISATDDRDTNARVWQEAMEHNVLMNVVDDTPHCNFIAPSILRRGDLTVAISTSGKAPAVAVRLREQLETMIGPEYAQFLTLAGAARAPLLARTPDFEERKALWYRLVDSDVFDLLRRGDEAGARARIAEILGVWPEKEEA